MNTRHHRTGFTMLELLVAMAMMGALAVSLYGTLRVAFRARDSATSAVAPVRAAQIAVDLIRTDLESALPPKPGGLAGPFRAQFGIETPNASTIQFHCAATDPGLPASTPGNVTPAAASPFVSGGIRRVELSVAQLPDGTMGLVRRTVHNLPLAVTEPLPQEEIICRGVRTFLLRYFDGLVWQDFWDSDQQLDAIPFAVELMLELERPGATSRDEPTYRVSRIFTLPCHQEPVAEEGDTGL